MNQVGRAVVELVGQPISAPTSARYESGQRAVPPDVLTDICQVLGLDAAELLRRADAENSATERPGGLGCVCDPSGPQGPAIRIRVALLIDSPEVWLDPMRGMLRLHADQDTDENGDLLLDEPLIQVIGRILICRSRSAGRA